MQFQSLLLTLLLTGSIFFVSQYQETQSETGNIRKDIFQTFQNWRQQYGIKYQDQEIDYRFKIFQENYDWIQKYNKEIGFEATGLNHMAALTQQEYIQTYLERKEQHNFLDNNPMVSSIEEGIQAGLKAEIPSSVDWVKKGAVNPVQESGSCSSSYAIASTDAIASIYQISGNPLIKLSPQQFVDCDDSNGKCRGGFAIYSYLYAMQYGVMSEESYPYTSRNGIAGTCQYDKEKVLYTPQNFYKIRGGLNQLIQQAVAQQPVTAEVDASSNSFRFYKGGDVPYNDNRCLLDVNNANYAVLITGYNTEREDVNPYWTIQTSFGTSWGNQGYMNIEDKDGYGFCGINNYVTFPGMTK